MYTVCSVTNVLIPPASPSNRISLSHSSQSGALARVARDSTNAAIDYSCYSACVAKVTCVYADRLPRHTRWSFCTPAAEWANSRKYHMIASTTSSVASDMEFTHESHIVTNTSYSMINRQKMSKHSLIGTQTPYASWSSDRPICFSDQCLPVQWLVCALVQV